MARYGTRDRMWSSWICVCCGWIWSGALRRRRMLCSRSDWKATGGSDCVEWASLSSANVLRRFLTACVGSHDAGNTCMPPAVVGVVCLTPWCLALAVFPLLPVLLEDERVV